VCSYASTTKPCPYGCSSGACNGPPSDGGTVEGGSTGAVGALCGANGDCAAGEWCSNDTSHGNPDNPSSTCVASCTGSSNGSPCGAGAGLCYKGTCFGACAFSSLGVSGSLRCAGNNTCFPLTETNPDGTAATLAGTGACFAGCEENAACPTGSACQVETGLCVIAPVAFAKQPGDACVRSNHDCHCIAGDSGTGFCTRFCGSDGYCPTGMTCGLTFADANAYTLYSSPLAAYCMANCTSSSDCRDRTMICASGMCYPSVGAVDETY
jgi:hypothetical protein